MHDMSSRVYCNLLEKSRPLLRSKNFTCTDLQKTKILDWVAVKEL